jgi:hypothetical protein
MLFIRHSIRKLIRLNLFANAKTIREGNVQSIEDQIITTRIYLVLLFSSLFILILFTSLVETTKSITIPTPSESEYVKLESAYPNTLKCSCREITIPYDSFLSIIPIYHQVRIFFILINILKIGVFK